LQTVIGSDLILVLDAGSVKELDTPHTLLQRQGSSFRSLVMETGASSSRRLMHVAKEKSKMVLAQASLRAMRSGVDLDHVKEADDDFSYWNRGIEDDFDFFSREL
jgi:ABC-type proline/glycine betaine transport system ATPase subunit